MTDLNNTIFDLGDGTFEVRTHVQKNYDRSSNNLRSAYIGMSEAGDVDYRARKIWHERISRLVWSYQPDPAKIVDVHEEIIGGKTALVMRVNDLEEAQGIINAIRKECPFIGTVQDAEMILKRLDANEAKSVEAA